MIPFESRRGQASVELVAVLPAVAVLGAVGWQAVLAGQAAWGAASAARAAARAVAVGGDARAAARTALPAPLERGLEVRPEAGGRVRVRVRVPRVAAALPVGRVSASARFEPQR